MSRVIVGVDPHKKSVTIEVVDERGSVLAGGRYGTDTIGYRTMLKQVRDQLAGTPVGGRGRPRCRPPVGATAAGPG